MAFSSLPVTTEGSGREKSRFLLQHTSEGKWKLSTELKTKYPRKKLIQRWTGRKPVNKETKCWHSEDRQRYSAEICMAGGKKSQQPWLVSLSAELRLMLQRHSSFFSFCGSPVAPLLNETPPWMWAPLGNTASSAWKTWLRRSVLLYKETAKKAMGNKDAGNRDHQTERLIPRMN